MPTAAKLAAAILFGALAWYISELVKPLFPEGTDLGRFSEYNALVGVFAGWRVAGPQARTTWPNAVSYGLTAALTMLVLTVLIHSFNGMLTRSLRRIYQGPMEALIDVVRISTGHLQMISTPEIMGTLLVGGVIGGLLTEWVGRNFK